MTFFVHGLTGHETMPMNRLFEKRPVNKTDQVYAYHAIDNKHIGSAEESIQKHHSHSDIVQQSYQSVEHDSDNHHVVLASEIMVTPVEVLSDTAMISEAISLFHAKQFRHVPVVSKDQSLVGMISDRDILRYSGSQFNEVTKVMKTDVVSASSDTDVRYIARLFVEGKIGAMPIIDSGKLTGILTRSDILRAVMKNFHIGLWA